MNKLQECQLDILNKTIEVLDKSKLRYYLAYGSLIGAVRHKGFIPWDDDIDIIMPRPDYEKFATIANNILPSDLFYQDSNTDKEYPYGFAKVRKNDTLFVQAPVAKLNIHQGVCIDIFPFDGCSKNGKIKKMHLKNCIFLHYISMVDSLTNSQTTQTFKKKIAIAFLKLCRFIIGKNRVRKILNKKAMKYDFDSSEYVALMVGSYSRRCVIPKKFFEENGETCSFVEFEKIKVKAPVDPDGVLKLQYGDYMTLPPEEERISYHQVLSEKY